MRRYLLAALRDTNAAEDVFQDFWTKFVEGRLWRADPARGRFRDYLKTTLWHLVADYRRVQSRQPQQLDSAVEPVAPSGEFEEAERGYVATFRKSVLDEAWTALEAAEHQGGQPYHTALQLQQERPQATSAEIAVVLTARLQSKTPWTAPGVRKLLQRARLRFAELILAEMERLQDGASLDRLEEGLIDLDLLRFCRVALGRRKERGEKPPPDPAGAAG
jgi:RNA polymerase sigma-70 factor (ECF subfamily)